MSYYEIARFDDFLVKCYADKIEFCRLVESELTDSVFAQSVKTMENQYLVVDIEQFDEELSILTEESLIIITNDLEIEQRFVYPGDYMLLHVSLDARGNYLSYTNNECINFTENAVSASEYSRFSRKDYEVKDKLVIYEGCKYETVGQPRDIIAINNLIMILCNYELQIIPIEFEYERNSNHDDYRKYGRVIEFDQFPVKMVDYLNNLIILFPSSVSIFYVSRSGTGELINKDYGVYDIFINVMGLQESTNENEIDMLSINDFMVVLNKDTLQYYKLKKCVLEDVEIINDISEEYEKIKIATGEIADRFNADDNLLLSNAMLLQNTLISDEICYRKSIEEELLLKSPIDTQQEIESAKEFYVRINDEVYFSLRHKVFSLRGEEIVPLFCNFDEKSTFLRREVVLDNKIEYYSVAKDNLVPELVVKVLKLQEFELFETPKYLEVNDQEGNILRLMFEAPFNLLDTSRMTIGSSLYGFSLRQDYETSLTLEFVRSYDNVSIVEALGQLIFTTSVFNENLLVIWRGQEPTQLLTSAGITDIIPLGGYVFILHPDSLDILLLGEQTTRSILLQPVTDIFESNGQIICLTQESAYFFAEGRFLRTAYGNLQRLEGDIFLSYGSDNLMLLSMNLSERWRRVDTSADPLLQQENTSHTGAFNAEIHKTYYIWAVNEYGRRLLPLPRIEHEALFLREAGGRRYIFSLSRTMRLHMIEVNDNLVVLNVTLVGSGAVWCGPAGVGVCCVFFDGQVKQIL